MSAFIEFEIDGKTYRYAGMWPSEVEDRLGDAQDRLIERYAREGYPARLPGDDLAPMMSIITEAGGTVLRVEGQRPDGTIQIEDLPDYRLY